MAETFTPLWSEKLSHDVFNVAISSDGNTIVATAGTSFSVFDARGHLLWRELTFGDCLSVSVSQDGQLIVASSSFGGVYLYNRDGKRMKQLTEEKATSVSMASDASCVAAALTSEEVVLLLPTNGKRQFWHCASPKPTVVATNADGSRVAVGSATGIISIRGSNGELITQLAAEGSLCGLALDPTASYLAAAPSNKPTLYFFSIDGTSKWSKSLVSSPLRVAISDGGDVVACADARRACLFGRDGAELVTADFGKPIYAVALTSDGSHIAVGGSGGIQYLKTSLSFNPASQSGSTAVAEALISDIRERYLNFPVDGICCWFKEFDLSLAQRKYVICEALLEEMDEGGYEIDATEIEWVKSRRGALALSRGISHELRKQFDKADKCYEEALQFQIACGNREGEGQVRALIVGPGEERQEQSVALMFHEQLRVLGSAEGCLTHRIETASPAELLKVIYSAKDIGHIEPLFAALNVERHDHPGVAANAAAALAFLEKPGAGIKELLEYLNHPNWFVRWRACSLVLRFLSTYGPSIEIQTAVTTALSHETDPDVLRELLSVVMAGGAGTELSDKLSPLLKDTDPDVRFLVCKALAQYGRRSELAAVRDVKEGQTFFSEYVSSAADEAYDAIEINDPELIVDSVYLHNRYTNPRDQIEARLFLQSEPVINGVIRLKNFQPYITLSVGQDRDDKSLFVLSIRSNYGSDFEFDLIPAGSVEYFMQDGEAHCLKFTLNRPLEGWKIGASTLYVYFDEEYVSECNFETVDSITFEHCFLSSAVNSDGLVISPTTVFAQGTSTMFCQVILENGVIGLPVEIHVFDSKKNLLRKDHRVTTLEGKERISFSWSASNLAAGEYNVELWAGDFGKGHCNFRIMDDAKITRAGMFSYVDWSGAARLPVSSYQPHEDFVFSADLTAPPGALISTELRWAGRRIFDAPVTCRAQGFSEQVGTVIYRRPIVDWPTGDYDITISANNAPVHTVEFQVKPVPLTQQIRELTNQSGDLLKSEGKAAGKSALLWSLKLSALAVLLFVMDQLVRVFVGEQIVRNTVLLNVGHSLGTTSLTWWVVGGVLLGIYQSVGRRFLSPKLFRIPRLLLIFMTQSIICQQATYIMFSPGYLWPNALGQLFSHVLYGAPLLAWLGVVMALGLVKTESHHRENAWVFPTEIVLLIFVVFLVYLVCLISSVLFGLAGWLLSVPLSSYWGWDLDGWSAGVSVGFIATLVSLLIIGRLKPARNR